MSNSEAVPKMAGGYAGDWFDSPENSPNMSPVQGCNCARAQLRYFEVYCCICFEAKLSMDFSQRWSKEDRSTKASISGSHVAPLKAIFGLRTPRSPVESALDCRAVWDASTQAFSYSLFTEGSGLHGSQTALPDLLALPYFLSQALPLIKSLHI